jgi:hypothetical protein
MLGVKVRTVSPALLVASPVKARVYGEAPAL